MSSDARDEERMLKISTALDRIAESVALLGRTMLLINKALGDFSTSSNQNLERIVAQLEIANQPFLDEDAEKRVLDKLEKVRESSDRLSDAVEYATKEEAEERHTAFLEAIADTENRIPPYTDGTIMQDGEPVKEIHKPTGGIKLSCEHNNINDCNGAGCPGPSLDVLQEEQRLNSNAIKIRKALESQPPVLTLEEFEQRRIACQGMSRPNWVIGAVVQVIDPRSIRYRRRGLVQELREDCVDIDFGDGGGDYNYYKVALISNTTVEERNRIMIAENIDESDAIQTIGDVPMAREILREMVEDTAWDPVFYEVGDPVFYEVGDPVFYEVGDRVRVIDATQKTYGVVGARVVAVNEHQGYEVRFPNDPYTSWFASKQLARAIEDTDPHDDTRD